MNVKTTTTEKGKLKGIVLRCLGVTVGLIKSLRGKRKLFRLTILIVVIIVGITLLRTTPFVKRVPLPGFVKSVFVSQSEEEKAKEQTKTLIAQVKEHMVIPDEEPVVATVTDASLLVREQKFFEGAENGDMLLVFPKAAKAIIYSAKRGLVVNVGPLIAPTQANGTELQNPTPSVQPSPSADKTTPTEASTVKPTTNEVKQ